MLLYTFSISQSAGVRLGVWQPFSPQPWLVLLVWASAAMAVQRQVKYYHADETQPALEPFLIPATLLLSGWGALEITRLSPAFGMRQAVWLGISVLTFCLGLRLPADLNFLRRYKYLWLTGGLLLAGLTIFFGVNPLGSSEHYWLGCCGVYLQPSEPLKLLLIIYLAAYLADRQYVFPAQTRSQSFLQSTIFGRVTRLVPLLAPTLLMAGLALAIMVVQRDLGTASIFLFLYTVMVYVATGNVYFLWAGGLGTLLAGAAGYLMFDVVRLRVEAWISPWADPSGRSFQIIQSLLAVANGGLLGRGPGLGSPGLVPVAHSDFIFTSIAEETGLLGAVGLLLVIGLISQRGLRLALTAPTVFPRLLAAGLSAYLAGQSILIIGGNLRLLPLTGVTLPFISYGGSSLLVSWIALLLLILINRAPHTDSSQVNSPAAYFQLGGLLAGGLLLSAAFVGWWSIYRSADLLSRTDNARRSIADRYVPRGSILDRENNPIEVNTGQPGSYARHSLYPPLGPVVGYTNASYGQAGLEDSLDAYLRGESGLAASSVIWSRTLYGTPPPGLAVRLTLDLHLQKLLDQSLENLRGAGVLLNAETGEILAMASHPSFDPNQLDQHWDALLQDPDAPLLNRAVQGLYPPGAALSPLLLAAALSEGLGSVPSTPSAYRYGVEPLQCAWTAQTTSSEAIIPRTWASVTAAGCPDTTARLGEILGSQKLLLFFQQLSLYTAPQVRLAAASSPAPATLVDAQLAALGLRGPAGSPQADLQISPLQLAMASAPLSAGGRMPTPRLALSYRQPNGQWILFAAGQQPRQVLPQSTSQAAAEMLAVPGLPIWRALAHLGGGDANPKAGLTWLTAGTLDSWQGSPLVLVILLEQDNPALAEQIGLDILTAIIKANP